MFGYAGLWILPPGVELRAAPGLGPPNFIGMSGVHIPEATGGALGALVGIGAGIGSFEGTLALY